MTKIPATSAWYHKKDHCESRDSLASTCNWVVYYVQYVEVFIGVPVHSGEHRLLNHNWGPRRTDWAIVARWAMFGIQDTGVAQRGL